jgi:hypothetical protein
VPRLAQLFQPVGAWSGSDPVRPGSYSAVRKAKPVSGDPASFILSRFITQRAGRVEHFGGTVDNKALRAALLDTNPETAFNPFGVNTNSPAVINKVLVTTTRVGTTRLELEDLKLRVTCSHSLPARSPSQLAASTVVSPAVIIRTR